MDLEGKVAIVTGSGSGIGAASAKRLAADGARVVVADLVEASAEATVEQITGGGGTATAHAVDTSDEDGMRVLVADTVARYGRLDILHNNAAAMDQAMLEGAVGAADLPLAVWERTLAVNLTGYLLGIRYALPQMRELGAGAIINTSSVVSFAPLPVQAAYATSKGAINSLTYSVATSYGRFGIRCNAICPGFIVNDTTSGAYTDEFRATALAAQPSNRLGRPEDIAALVSFLASDDAAYINGQVMSVDGGLTVPGALYPYMTSQADPALDPA